MHNQANDDQNQSMKIPNINDQSFASEKRGVRQKFNCAKNKSGRWRNNLKKSITHRQNLLSKNLIDTHGSFIRIHDHHNDLMLTKNLRNQKKHEMITINVSGDRYETHLSTLENYPNTLLGNRKKRQHYWNNEAKEYFFDRHRACFEAILYYYQSNGRLRRPDYVPLDTFLEEISFFDLGPQALAEISKLENVSIVKHIDLPRWLWRRYIYFYLEYPQHSIFARILHLISIVLTVLSCVALAFETLPEYEQKYDHFCSKMENITLTNESIPLCTKIFSSPFFLIQTACVFYFTIEFVLRLISTPSYRRFVLSVYNWTDLGATVPYFIFLGLGLTSNRTGFNQHSFVVLRLLRVLRFLRALKIYLIFKQLKSLRVLSATLKESFVDFILMITILTLLAFLFGTATYFAEQDVNGEVFDSIPRATYWGIITLTTVGYGDMYPVTVIGRILACVCAFFGVATSAMLVSVLVDRYQRVYNRKQFYPEQILSSVDSSDSEQEEKQDFINRKLSGTKKTLSSVPLRPAPSILVSLNNRINSRYSASSSHIRFVISITDNNDTSKNPMFDVANELMKELTETVRTSGEQVHLKLISTDIPVFNDEISTNNESSSIIKEEEEDEF